MGKKKVIARIYGGLGNQLFIYSAARRLSIKNNSELIIDNVSGFANDVKYKRVYQLSKFNIKCRLANKSERLEPFFDIRRKIGITKTRFIPKCKNTWYIQNGIGFDPRMLELKLNGLIRIEGYWQSEDYFKDISEIIKNDLKLIIQVDNKNDLVAQDIAKNNSIAVHFRFFDTNISECSENVENTYYEKAYQYIESIISNPHYYVFSDMPKLAYEKFTMIGKCFTVIDINNDLIDGSIYDFWLMSQCQHFIIANSTFSWWGAWLSPNKNKIVVAPNLPGTNWNIENRIPKEWILL
jgi:hypothetical protein